MQVLVINKLNFAVFVDNFNKFLASKFMIPVWMCAFMMSHIFALETAMLTIIAFSFIYIMISKTHIRAMLPLLLMCFYLTSNTYSDILNGYMIQRLWYVICIAFVMIIAFVIGVYKRKLKFRLTWGFLGVLIMGASLIPGGIISQEYDILNFAGGLMITAFYVAFYLVAAFVSKEIEFEYFAQVVVASSIVVMMQLTLIYIDRNIFYYIQNHTFAVIKAHIYLGWGISNLIAPMIAVGMPFTVYLMVKHKNPMFMFTILVLQTAAAALTLSRALMIFSTPFAIIGIIYAIARHNRRGRWQLAVGLAVVLISIIIVAQIFWEQLVEFWEIFMDGRGRDELWHDALDAFLANPIFGAGVAYRLNDPFRMSPLFLVHNTPLQFMMWGGIIGFLAFMLHSVQVLATAFRRPSEKRLILLFAFGMIYAHSMLDVMVFFPFTLLFYIFFMSIMDADSINSGGFSLVTRKDKQEVVKELKHSGTVYGNNLDARGELPWIFKAVQNIF